MEIDTPIALHGGGFVTRRIAQYNVPRGYTSMRVCLTFLICIFAPTAARCQTNVLQFTAYPKDALYQNLMNDFAWKIFATGEIDPDAAARLEALIQNKRIPQGSILYLSSPGGSLAGGITLGRIIRKYGLNTSIGQSDPSQNNVGIKPGYCYSACATAFLGGVFRYWNEGSVYGVHRFFSNVHSDKDADTAQIVSAALVEYIRSMGVNTKIFSIASQAGADDVITPPHEVLLQLNVINDGREPPKWTIESVPQMMYLKGEQETDNGVNKFLVICPADKGTLVLIGMFEGGPNIKRTFTFPVNWLFLDGGQLRIDRQLQGKEIVNDHVIMLTYFLDAHLLAAISNAKTVGIGLQPSTASPIFAGFNYMPFAEGAAKLPGFLAVCNRGPGQHVQ